MIALAAGVAAVVLPLGLACAAILTAYLVSMGIDAEAVALSPLGPSQSGRFYGVNNLLETMLLVPSLVGAALLGRAGIAVAALAFVTIGGNRFGADGGGLVVLGAAYLVLLLRLSGRRLTLAARGGGCGRRRRARAPPARRSTRRRAARATSRGALGDGPVALARDVGDRIELSVRRTAASVGAIVFVLVSLAILACVALAARRATPCSTPSSSASRCRSLVNDTPGDVLGMGAAAAFALARAAPAPPGSRRLVRLRAMRRAALLALLALSLGVAGCGGGEEVVPDARRP